MNGYLSLFVLFCIVFFAGYQAIQFDERHYFYLEFMSVWCLGFTLQMAWNYLSNLKKYNQSIFYNISQRNQVIIPLALILLGGMVSLQAVRLYQSKHLKELFTVYLNAKSVDLNTIDVVSKDKTLIKLVEQQNGSENKYLKITFSPLCMKNTLSFSLNFNKFSPLSTRRFLVDNYKNATLFYPIYQSPKFFDGVEIASKDRACINNIAMVENNKALRLHPVLWLPEDWQQSMLYQHFSNATLYSLTDDKIDLKMDNITNENLVSMTDIYNSAKNTIKGFIPLEKKGISLAWLPSKEFPDGSKNRVIFYAEGIIKRGGINIGLVNRKTNLWAQQIQIKQGRFRLFLKPNNSDENISMISNSIERYNDATINKIGWVTLD